MRSRGSDAAHACHLREEYKVSRPEGAKSSAQGFNLSVPHIMVMSLRSKWKAPAFADAERSRTRTTTRTRTIGEAEDGNQDPRWRVPSASKRSINRVNIATTRVWLFLLASSASPIVLVLRRRSRPRPLCIRSRLEKQPSLRARTVYPSLML